MDKKILGALIILGVAIVGVVAWGMKGSETSAPAEITGTIYYYGAECPHCQKVNEFLETNKISEKVTFAKKEVWHDKKNAEEMVRVAEACGIAKGDVGVPFIFDNGKCLIGEPDVRKFFSEKAGLTQ